MSRVRAPDTEQIIEADRVNPAVFNQSRFNLPPAFLLKNREWVYSFVAFRSNGFECRDTYAEQCSRYWAPVGLEEYEEQHMGTYRSPFGRKDDTDGLVERGGQILMKRRRDIHDMEEAAYDKRNAESMKFLKTAVVKKGMSSDEYVEYNRRFKGIS
jgi:hypothetical protein